MAEQHTILGGKVYVYKRPNSSRWQCSSFFAGKNRRTSTKEESLAKAKDVAEDWYLQLRGKLLTGELKAEKTFREVSEQFLRECEIMTRGERSKQYVKGQHLRSSVHLVPFFGNMDISKITTGKIVDYRVHRHQQAIAKRGKPPAHSTMHHEIVTLRQTLMEGANIYQIAKNCRTSVGMIEKYYGVHVKNSLNAAAINVVRSGKDVMAEEEE
jgi:hypothetical protein